MPRALLNVLIVGCGNVAGAFDFEQPPGALPLTHAGALSRHGAFRLAACVEPDGARRRTFMQRWSIPLGEGSMEALRAHAGSFDVISICSPTALHAEHLEAALSLRPRLVFCEKPVTPSLGETNAWVERYERAGVLLAVNHTRRWAPDIVRLREELVAGAWGALRSVVGHYNKGVLNNGSHMVDLLHFLLGPLELLAVGYPENDFWLHDPTVPALLRTAQGISVHLTTSHAGDYALFELELVTAAGVIAMEDGGAAWRVRRTGAMSQFPGYRSLDSGDRSAGQYANAMLRAADNLHGAVISGVPLASSGRSALDAQRVCDAIRVASASAAGASATIHRTLP